MGTWAEDIVAALEALGGSGTYEEIYGALAGMRPTPMPRSWRQIVQRQIQDLSSDSAGFRGRGDLFFAVSGIGKGIWGLRTATADTPHAVDLQAGDESLSRVQSTTYRILRDTQLARQIKLLHRNKCQICGLALEIGGGRTYSEAHHVVPLGKPHNGPDTAGNIVVLCPNHHAQCDVGAIALDLRMIRSVAGHDLSVDSVEYHNAQIYIEQT